MTPLRAEMKGTLLATGRDARDRKPNGSTDYARVNGPMAFPGQRRKIRRV